MRVTVGTRRQLEEKGCLTGKAGSQPICVLWHGGRAYALDDRCPHMGFPLHRGTVESGLVTCHWHHARFDLESGGTLDPFADDVRAYPVEMNGDDVVVVVEAAPEPLAHHLARLEDGLEQGLTLVTAKAVLGLLDGGTDPRDVVRAGAEWGCRYRGAGWGAGLTVLVAMANVLPDLDPGDAALALVHGLAFVSRDTRGRPPRFPLPPLGGDRLTPARLSAWYRRFIDSRSADAAERTLATAIASGASPAALGQLMTAAVTDHVFLDGGHTLDFTNKAFEAVALLGWDCAGDVLPTLVAQTAAARRHEEEGEWRHPHDLAGLLRGAADRLPELLERAQRARGAAPGGLGDEAVESLAWQLLGEEPEEIVAAVDRAILSGATPEELGRAVAYAAALRIVRFHVQNDHGDWDVVHHGFTAANALHQLLVRSPSPDALRGVYHLALRVFLDRFLNVPAARLPSSPASAGPAPSQGQQGPGAGLAVLQRCWDEQGRVDDAGAIAYRHARSGSDRRALVAALGRALLTEDAEFHWFQTYEAAVRQASHWPPGSEPAALILAGAARFLAAHTPTRRELAQVVRIATRLRRGEALFDDISEAADTGADTGATTGS
ncbi:MAG TPA: Rieske 2Fe-2S domain-containing protein [Acidimicrobiales bacterium]|nr:Rieske 2Fe-2S domain-containing protein [Acidimicrobiales bacterium]